MLNLMRKHAGSWMIKVILFAIVVVFVFWGVGTMRSQKAVQVAEVNGEIITYDQYQQVRNRLLDNYRQIYGDQFDEKLLAILKPNEMALDQLIERILLTQEAQRLEIEVSDAEVAQAIRNVSAFQNNGVFNLQRYNWVLAQNNMNAEQFEMEQSREMMMNKLRAVVLTGVIASDDEARQWYDWSNAKVSIDYALFSPDRYQDVKPTSEEIQAYFNDHKENYRTAPKVKVRYVFFDPALYIEQVNVTDNDVEDYYYAHTDEFKTEKRVKARHILLKVDANTDEKADESKKAEALKIYEKAKSGEDFAGLAQKYSEGPSKDQGGDLGWFTREQMVEPFADKAFSLAEGEISEPVKTQFGWHIIKVEQIEDAAVASKEEASQEIRRKLTDGKARELALENAEALYDTVFDGDDLGAAASAHEMPAHETGFFSAGEFKDKNIPQAQKFSQTAFSLEKMAISEIQDYGNGYYILQVTDRMEAAIPEFDQVADAVTGDVTKEQQGRQAKTEAEAFLAKVREGAAFDAAAASYNIPVRNTDFFGRDSAIPQIGYEQQVSGAAFELSEDKPLPEKALQGSSGWYAIRLKERQAPDDTGFGKEKKAIAQRLTEQKRQSAYQSWLTDLRSRSDIKINRALIEN